MSPRPNQIFPRPHGVFAPINRGASVPSVLQEEA